MNQLRKQLILLGFYARRSFVYKLDALSDLLGAISLVALMVYFWGLAGDIDALGDDFSRLSYFLVSYSAVRLSVGNHFYYVGTTSREIQSGGMAQMLLMPLDAFRHIYAKTFGLKASVNAAALFMYITGLVLGGLSASDWLLVLALSIIMMFIGYYLNMLTSVFSLTIVDSAGVRFGLSFIIRIVAGVFVPLSLMPGALRPVLEYSPFSFVSYWVSALGGQLDVPAIKVLLVGVGWVVLLRYAAIASFRWGLSKAEVVGL